MRKIPDHLYGFESHWLDLDGLRYHYLDEGEGEVVVAVHGNPSWSFYYRDLVKALSDDWRVVVPDHMGCGLSDKPSDDDYDYTLSRRIDDFGTLMDDLDLLKKMGKNGRGIVEKELSNHVEAEKLLDLYTSVGFK